ncbi:hem peroxidase [Arabidopsis thaliana x Arabidopsis arenosa]|uniref:L-ascorbate peroxidase n=1 Tax=Arabidopsis thaliana x Arabidopsis arenosa TaxID=1240361 RepID=A0A8T2BIY8_9BRAS|nr:hem peroxidase [Arabidopsis thaliana x Arabidopsis arenosa]
MAVSLSAASHLLCSSTRVSLSPAVASSSSPVVALSSSSSPHSLSSLRSVASSSLFPHSSFVLQKKHPINGTSTRMVSPKCAASDAAQLRSAKEEIKVLLRTKFCHPILVRLGWHDAGTYNKNIEEWPQRGGANGSLRFEAELKHAANAGLLNALKLIQPIKDKYPNISYADLFQLASATAVEEAGGPEIPMKYGRVDVVAPEQCPEEGRLPDAGPPSPADHLRDVFYRMGLDDKEIVALSGAHTLGRARPDRSGWGKPETKYTKTGPGEAGGQSWTVKWLKFDNSYFKDIKEKRDEDLLVLPTDAALFEDPSFKNYAEKYAEDPAAFFKDYAEAHAKLSNLGAKFDPPEGIIIDNAPEKFVAAKYSTGKKELSDSMKKKIRAEYEAIGGSPDKPLPTNYFLNIIIAIGVLVLLSTLFGGNNNSDFSGF